MSIEESLPDDVLSLERVIRNLEEQKGLAEVKLFERRKYEASLNEFTLVFTKLNIPFNPMNQIDAYEEIQVRDVLEVFECLSGEMIGIPSGLIHFASMPLSEFVARKIHLEGRKNQEVA